MNAKIKDVRVVALHGGIPNPALPIGPISFRAGLLYGRTPEGVIFELARYEGDEVSGTPCSEADLEQLVRGGDAAMLLEPFSAEDRLVVWFVSSELVAEVTEPLRRAQALVRAVRLPFGRALVVRRPQSDRIRDDLSAHHAKVAHEGLLDRSWGTCSASIWLRAELAWMYARAVTPALVALLVVATRISRGAEAAEDVRAVERNTWGEAFDQAVETEILALTRALFLGAPERGAR